MAKKRDKQWDTKSLFQVRWLLGVDRALPAAVVCSGLPKLSRQSFRWQNWGVLNRWWEA